MSDYAPYRPFTAFNFKVNLRRSDGGGPICEAEFSECSGLEMNMTPKTIREGGNNGQQIHLPGPISYGQLTLKRGMTVDFGLWDWFEEAWANPWLRASGEVLMLPSDQDLRDLEDVRIELTGCLPIKLKAPDLNAKEGQIAIEEMQIAYATMHKAD
jgi:phage tail-like protein